MDTSESIEPDNIFVFWRNLALIVIFFVLTPVALATSLFSLVSISNSAPDKIDSTRAASFIQSPRTGIKVYASLPEIAPSVSSEVQSADARPEIVRQYLLSYTSPLEPYSQNLVETADKYGLDFRLLTAIAQQESNLCKKIPANSFNCWGWGIHSEGSLGFVSFEEGINEVSKGIREEYINKGYVTPEQIMSKYTPQSNGSWANGVNRFMEEMQ